MANSLFNISTTKAKQMPPFALMFAATMEEIKRRMAESNPSNVVPLRIFEGATVGSGTFLYFPPNSLEAVNGWAVAQILSVMDLRDVSEGEINKHGGPVMSRRSTLRSAAARNVCLPSPIQKDASSRMVLLRKMEYGDEDDRPPRALFYHLHDTTKEVIMTTILQWIPMETICQKAAIAFVYHLGEVQSGERPCCGEINTFFIQHKWDDKGTACSMLQDKFQPFFSPYGMKSEQFPQRISNFITSLTEKCFKVLTSSKASHDCQSKHLHMEGSNYEAYQYLDAMSRLLLEQECQPKSGGWCTKRSKKMINNDLSVSNKRRRIVTEARRYTIKSQINALRLVLGANFAMGPMIEAPSMKDIKSGRRSDTVQLRQEDEVRLVSCMPDEDAIEYNPNERMR